MAKKRKQLEVELNNAIKKKFKMSLMLSAKLQQYSQSKEEKSQTPLLLKKKKRGGYICQVCFVSYSGLHSLKCHFARYEDPKYPCYECGTKFSNVRLLQSHIAFTHGAERLKNYRMKCPVCNQNTHMEANLRAHICHVHSEWVVANFNKFVAEFCAGETEFSSDRKRQIMMKFVKHIIRTTPNKDNETAPDKNGSSKNNYQKDSLSEASKVYRDAESLRVRYSCKDCYVPLPRIDFRKNTSIRIVTPVKQHKKSPEKTFSYRADESKRREEIGPIKQLQSKSLAHEGETQKQLELVDIEVRLDKLPESNVFVKAECDGYENFEISIPVTEALEECVDPLDLGESPTEKTNTFVHYPESFDFPMKIETRPARTENPEQSKETSIGLLKVESMDCDDSPERIEVMDENPELKEILDQPQTVQYYYGEPSGEIDDASTECIDTFEPVKVEIEEHPISEHSECRSEDVVERPEIPDSNSSIIETSSSSPSASQKTQIQESCTMVASKICNKLFTSRRTMLRHFRKRHLSCFDDAVYCVCGKEMNGRRAMEKHFSRHCDRLVKTTRATSENKICKPLEKKYKCTKCGQRFWLSTCLEDHPPNCELPKPKPVNPCRLIKNVNRAYGLTSHFGEGGEYICRICDVKFTSIHTLLRHLRSFSTNDKCTCVHCGTSFTGQRLLKGHVQSTHELNPTTTYTYFCEICNQGFTKRINHRIHTMHIHPKEMMNRVIEGPTSYVSSTDSVAPVVANTPENQCNVCNLVFVSQKRFLDHVSYYNKSDHYRCNICGEEFEGQYKAHNHRKKVHYDGKMKTTYTHYCDLCKEGFMYKTHLHAHMFHVHDNQFNCVTSVKDYNLPAEEAHLMENEISCKQCSKKFSTVSVLVAHMQVYHGEDPTKISKVKCSQCDRQFSTLGDCIYHLKHFHGTQPLSQTSTPKRFQPSENSSTSADVIDIDISIVDEKVDRSENPNTEETQPRETDEANTRKPANEKEDIPTPSSVCFTCGFDCPGPWGLARHRALYLNSGIYVCEFCGRRFSWQTYYRDHKLKHFRRDVHNNYFCPVCDEGFDTVNDLQMHAIHLHEEPLDALKCGPVPTSSRANIFKDQVNGSNAIDNPHQLLTNTLGNNCEDKYEKVVQLQRSATSVLKQNRVVGGDTPDDAFNSSNRYPMCNICNMAFISKEMLKIHRENSHSLVNEKDSTTVKPGSRTRLSETIEDKPQAHSNDRFYVLLGEKVHALTIDSIGKRISTCNKNIGLTSKLYRYDIPLTCDVCNLTFQSKDMLYNHREFLHKIQTNFIVKSTGDNETQSSQTKIVENSGSKSPGHVEKTSRVKVRSTASIPALQSSTQKDENIGAGDNPTTSPPADVKKVHYYKCGHCDIVFNDKHFMAVHEEKVHGLKPGDDDSLNEVTIQPMSSITTASQSVCVDNLWLGSKPECYPPMPQLTPCRPSASIVNPVIRNNSPEEILISDDETEVSAEIISTATNRSFNGDKESTSPPPLRLINLPPGNYKISKLKVRSTDTGKVVKLVKSIK